MFVVSAFKRSICMIVSCGVPSQIDSLKVQTSNMNHIDCSEREREITTVFCNWNVLFSGTAVGDEDTGTHFTRV